MTNSKCSDYLPYPNTFINLFVGGITLIKDLCIKYQIRSNI